MKSRSLDSDWKEPAAAEPNKSRRSTWNLRQSLISSSFFCATRSIMFYGRQNRPYSGTVPADSVWMFLSAGQVIHEPFGEVILRLWSEREFDDLRWRS